MTDPSVTITPLIIAKRFEGSSYQTIVVIFSDGEVVADPFGVCSGSTFVFSRGMSASFGLTLRLIFFSSPLFSAGAAAGFCSLRGSGSLEAQGLSDLECRGPAHWGLEPVRPADLPQEDLWPQEGVISTESHPSPFTL